jgi:hypothetical protein
VIDVTGLRFVDAGSAALFDQAARRAPAGIQLVGCNGTVFTVLDCLGVTDEPRLRLTRADADGGAAEAVG